MNIVLHAEMIVGGLVTGTMIGFFWHPAAVFAAVLAAALLVHHSRDNALS